MLSSKKLFNFQITQDLRALSLPAVLLSKNQLSRHTPLTLTQITILVIPLQFNKTSTAPLQNKTSLVCYTKLSKKMQEYLFQLIYNW